MKHYRICGLAIAADLELPFADTAEASPEVDVVIRRGEVPPASGAPAASGPFWSLDGGQFLFTVPGIVRGLVANGRDITFEVAPEADAADAAPFLMGTAFGVLLHQRGLMVLHAGSVAVGDKAVLFCGPTGAGKSTMVASLAQRGCPLISDEVCIVDFDVSGAPLVRPDGRLIRLWGRVVDALSLGEQRRDAVRRSIEKYYVAPEVAAAADRYPICAVYRLRPTRGSEPPRIVRANVAEAAISLRQSTYRPRYVAAAGLHERQFVQVTHFANRVGVFDLCRPLDFGVMPDTVASLMRHWQELGVVETVA